MKELHCIKFGKIKNLARLKLIFQQSTLPSSCMPMPVMEIIHFIAIGHPLASIDMICEALHHGSLNQYGGCMANDRFSMVQVHTMPLWDVRNRESWRRRGRARREEKRELESDREGVERRERDREGGQERGGWLESPGYYHRA